MDDVNKRAYSGECTHGHMFNKGYSIFKGYPGGGDLKVIRNAGLGGIKSIKIWEEGVFLSVILNLKCAGRRDQQNWIVVVGTTQKSSGPPPQCTFENGIALTKIVFFLSQTINIFSINSFCRYLTGTLIRCDVTVPPGGTSVSHHYMSTITCTNRLIKVGLYQVVICTYISNISKMRPVNL